MNKKKTCIFIVIIVIAIVLITFFVQNVYDIIILRSDNNQVEALNNIYQSFIQENLKNTNSYTVILSKSAQTNFITGNIFSDENIRILKSTEFINSYSSDIFELLVKYNNKNHILTLILYSENEEMIYELSQKYSVSIDEYEITCTKHGDISEQVVYKH